MNVNTYKLERSELPRGRKDIQISESTRNRNFGKTIESIAWNH